MRIAGLNGGVVRMRKIVIIGSPGAGKSTLARRLGQATRIPVIHLDSLFWRPGWTATPRPEWIRLHTKAISGEEWIIDGHYGSTLDLRIQAADTIVFLDVPRWLCLWRVCKRAVQYVGRTRPDMAEGCREKLDVEFLRYVWGFRRREQAGILRRLQDALREGKCVIHLRTRAQVERFLSEVQVSRVAQSRK